MNPILKTNWSRRMRSALNGLAGGHMIELLANPAWLG
jgi:hypothetical protein